MGRSWPLFLYFCLFNKHTVDSKQIIIICFLPMTGFELPISDIRSDRSANSATTTATIQHILSNQKY